jgi:4-amino-4-deoxychorismate lyase
MQCLKNAIPVQAVSIIDRAFHYGDGCFTTARIRNNQIELFDHHLERMKSACERLFLHVDMSLVEQSLRELKQCHSFLNGTLKVVISRGGGQRGYSLPEQNADLWMFYYPSHLEDFNYEIIESGVLEQTIGLCMPSLVGIKSLNRLEQVLLKKEADQKKWLEALTTDLNGNIVEGVSSNCFIRINDTWICPELRYNGIHGVMRAEILRRMNIFNIQCEQRMVHLNELKQIQSVFYCNALHPMKIASCLNDQQLDVQSCMDLFHTLQLSQIS